MRVLAVDWSGKLKRPEEFLWLAEVHDGELVGLENGRGRAELIAQVVDRGDGEAETVAGFDFAFSFPKWWCDERGWSDVRQVWATIATEGERLLAACEVPLWGRPGTPNPNLPDRRFRRTEREAGESSAKSVFPDRRGRGGRHRVYSRDGAPPHARRAWVQHLAVRSDRLASGGRDLPACVDRKGQQAPVGRQSRVPL
jgi:hypothetical protein